MVEVGGIGGGSGVRREGRGGDGGGDVCGVARLSCYLFISE